MLERNDDARRHFEHALARNEALEVQPALVRSECEYGAWLAARGESDRAEELLGRAEERAARIGAKDMLERVRAVRG